MSEKIKINGSLGRGIHYLKQLVDVNGNPADVYRILTDLQYKVTNKPHQVGETSGAIETIYLAGGPLLKEGTFLPELNKTIVQLYDFPNFGVVLRVQ